MLPPKGDFALCGRVEGVNEDVEGRLRVEDGRGEEGSGMWRCWGEGSLLHAAAGVVCFCWHHHQHTRE